MIKLNQLAIFQLDTAMNQRTLPMMLKSLERLLVGVLEIWNDSIANCNYMKSNLQSKIHV